MKWSDPYSPLPRADRLKGPVILVGLIQSKVEDTLSFDWRLLSDLFRDHVLDSRGQPLDGRAWRMGSAKRVKLQGWRQYIGDSDTVPNWIGQGYDMSKDEWCMFGARFDLSPFLTLGEIDTELRLTEGLIKKFASGI